MKEFVKAIACISAVLLLLGQARAHDISVPVIVDTDMGMDDARALAMLLHMQHLRVPLIVTSDGAVSPRTGGRRAAAMLAEFGRQGTRVGVGSTLERPAPRFRARLEDMAWPGTPEGAAAPSDEGAAAGMIVETVRRQDRGLLYICLGPLTNLAEALRMDPGIRDRISWLLYYGGDPGQSDAGWNTERDRKAALAVFDAGIRIYAVDGEMPFDRELLQHIQGLDTRASRFVSDLHAAPAAMRMMEEGHFFVWDELAVVYLARSGHFDATRTDSNVFRVTVADEDGVAETYAKLLGRSADVHLEDRQAVILREFPTGPALFREDVAPYVPQIIERYGLEEWKACLLTNELHRHLGIYSLIGAKMGIRAREILEAPFDTLQVISYAGMSTPLSCLNDGLQVSTGASLGRGAIEVREGDPRPEAVFVYGDRRLTLRLKPEWIGGIREDIRAAAARHEGVNDAYFEAVRRLSMRYWLELDRAVIFVERFD